MRCQFWDLRNLDFSEQVGDWQLSVSETTESALWRDSLPLYAQMQEYSLWLIAPWNSFSVIVKTAISALVVWLVQRGQSIPLLRRAVSDHPWAVLVVEVDYQSVCVCTSWAEWLGREQQRKLSILRVTLHSLRFCHTVCFTMQSEYGPKLKSQRGQTWGLRTAFIGERFKP